MAEETGQEKTEEPTAKRLREAREKGQLPRSRELTTALVLLAGSGGLYFLGGDLGSGIASLLRDGLSPDLARIAEPAFIVHSLGAQIMRALFVLVPLFMILVAVAVTAPLALGGWMFSGKSMAPKLEKLNPLKGLARIFGPRGLVELAKALAKVVVVGGMAVILLQDLVDDFIGLGRAFFIVILLFVFLVYIWKSKSSLLTELLRAVHITLDEHAKARFAEPGHALIAGDFLGLGYDQVVAGWRAGAGADKKVGLKLYLPTSQPIYDDFHFEVDGKEASPGGGEQPLAAAQLSDGQPSHSRAVIAYPEASKPLPPMTNFAISA